MPNKWGNPKFFFILLLGLLSSVLHAQQPRAGDLENLIEAIRGGMPGRDSQKYVVPTQSQQDSFALIIDAVLAEDYAYADSLAGFWGYTLYEYTDQGNGNRLYYVLMEDGSDKTNGLKRGWGTYIFDPDGSDKVTIEVPHPYWDTNTWIVGFSAYQSLQAKYFLMAGTHRYANGSNPAPADVAHNTDNMFHHVHTKVAPLSQHTLQVHGYSRSTREEYASYPDVVLSNGTPNPSAILDSLDKALEDQGYTSGIYDGISFGYLAATTNKQGQFSNAHGYSFAHMELEYFIRISSIERGKVYDALESVFYLETSLSQPAIALAPETISLGHNYPNPFNPATMIPFTLHEKQSVRLHIYDTLGRKLRTLTDASFRPGVYEIVWDGMDDYGKKAASGMYYYVLQSGVETQVQSMILLR